MTALTVVEVPPVDRKEWAAGPWDDEADAYRWTAHGLECNLLRNQLGAWCGYVAVPETHPDYRVDYYDLDYDVHYGLTYGAESDWVKDGISYKRPFSFGFDCAHLGDLVPYTTAKHYRDYGISRDSTYRTVEWVATQTEWLAEQIADGRSRQTSDRNIFTDIVREMIRDEEAGAES
jgi:hypothetical protein